MATLTCDVLEQHEVEHVVQVEVELGDDHPQHVGHQEHQGEAADARQVAPLLPPRVAGRPGAAQQEAAEAEGDVSEGAGDGAEECGQDEGEHDGGDAEAGVDVVVDAAGEVHLLAEDVLAQHPVHAGDGPHRAQGDLVEDSEPQVEPVLLLHLQGGGIIIRTIRVPPDIGGAGWRSVDLSHNHINIPLIKYSLTISLFAYITKLYE